MRFAVSCAFICLPVIVKAKVAAVAVASTVVVMV